MLLEIWREVPTWQQIVFVWMLVTLIAWGLFYHLARNAPDLPWHT
jgi:hypothetical protein